MDNDGMVSKNECMQSKHRFSQEMKSFNSIDVNNDGNVAEDEFTAYSAIQLVIKRSQHSGLLIQIMMLSYLKMNLSKEINNYYELLIVRSTK